jgi:glyoxylase-like metal-dependent hydrolase (beta-lactamase superfamily II)
MSATSPKGRPPLYPLWKPPVLHLVGHFLRNGVARTEPVAEASGFADEEVLDVPGRPLVIHTPGHTAGNAALSLADREVLIVGDTLATLSLSPGESGPQLLPRFMNEDHDRALASLEKIEPVRLAGSCPVTVFPGRAVRSRPSSWPGRSRPGQVERPARLTRLQGKYPHPSRDHGCIPGRDDRRRGRGQPGCPPGGPERCRRASPFPVP